MRQMWWIYQSTICPLTCFLCIQKKICNCNTHHTDYVVCFLVIDIYSNNLEFTEVAHISH